MPLLLSGIFIFFARVIDMSLATFRILLIMRGRSLAASLIGFLESGLYIVALTVVVKNINSPLSILLYAAGFGVGTYTGSFIEERVALGYVNVQIISIDSHESMQTRLREEGFGVTSLEGYGKDGAHSILNVLLKRRDLPRIMELVNSEDKKLLYQSLTQEKLSAVFPEKESKIGHPLGNCC